MSAGRTRSKKATAPTVTVCDAIATALGYRQPTDGVLGSAFEEQIAYYRAWLIAEALGLKGTLDVEHVRAFGRGEILHLHGDHRFDA